MSVKRIISFTDTYIRSKLIDAMGFTSCGAIVVQYRILTVQVNWHHLVWPIPPADSSSKLASLGVANTAY